jgi:hypothetical protein
VHRAGGKSQRHGGVLTDAVNCTVRRPGGTATYGVATPKASYRARMTGGPLVVDEQAEQLSRRPRRVAVLVGREVPAVGTPAKVNRRRMAWPLMS